MTGEEHFAGFLLPFMFIRRYIWLNFNTKYWHGTLQ